MHTSVLVPRSARPQKVLGDAYLKFQIDKSVSAALLMKQVQEVLVLQSFRLTPMPNMPTCVLGLMNRRSHVLWVVDLAQMMGFGCLDPNTQQHNIAIARIGKAALGIAVHQVEGMGWLSSDEIQPAPNHLPAEMLSYLRGCVLQDQQVRLVIDAEAILQSPMLCDR